MKKSGRLQIFTLLATLFFLIGCVPAGEVTPPAAPAPGLLNHLWPAASWCMG